VNYGFTMVLVFPFRLTPLCSVMLLLPAFNIGDCVKIRRYLVLCTPQFGSNLTKIIFQGKHFNYFIVVGGWHHVFWSDTHYSISLRYTRNIVQLNSFYNTITNWRVSLSKYVTNDQITQYLMNTRSAWVRNSSLKRKN
jgi:hypothetical protein